MNPIFITIAIPLVVALTTYCYKHPQAGKALTLFLLALIFCWNLFYDIYYYNKADVYNSINEKLFNEKQSIIDHPAQTLENGDSVKISTILNLMQALQKDHDELWADFKYYNKPAWICVGLLLGILALSKFSFDKLIEKKENDKKNNEENESE